MRGTTGFAARDVVNGNTNEVDQALPPWSITVIDLRLSHALGAVSDK
jgi:hypothetical protein